tara:strand:- start:3432 stop:3656 length:225 start_codon:yes stop_codon:yes gene_type:complete
MEDLKTKKLYKAIKKQMRKNINKYFEENTMVWKQDGTECVDFCHEENKATYFELLESYRLIKKTYKKFINNQKR